MFSNKKFIQKPRNIIVRMPNWLGDAVMASPILKKVKQKWPTASLTALCQDPIGTLFENDPHVDKILRFKKTSSWEKPQIIHNLKNHNYDLGILLTNSFSSAWQLWKGDVRYRVGFKGNLRSILLNKAINFPKNLQRQHLVHTYQNLLEALGIKGNILAPQLFLNADLITQAKKKLQNEGVNSSHTIIGINPGAAYGSAKCWIPERFTQLARKLLTDKNNRIIFFGDQHGKELVDQICSSLPKEVINFAGKTSLQELMALIKSCDIFLTNDSGPMHLASALKTLLLALFGSTSAIKTGPYAGGRIIHKHVKCSPCYKRHCPINFPCMKNIHVEEVYTKLTSIYKGSTRI